MKTLIRTLIVAPFLLFANATWAECPPEGCPPGQVCVGNPIYAVCKDKNSYQAGGAEQERGQTRARKVAPVNSKAKKIESAKTKGKNRAAKKEKQLRKSGQSKPAMKESGEKGGTADINIGVGELQE